MKVFTEQSTFWKDEPKEFTSDNPPKWLNLTGPKGSTMDDRWFWEDHILKLEVGETKETDFKLITRIK